MTRLDISGRSTQALLAGNVVLAALIALHIVVPAAPSASVSEAPSAEDGTLPEFGDVTLNPPALSVLGEMLDRPLFFADRRFPEPAKEEAPPPPKPLMLKLQGVALAGGSRVAVLRNTSNKLLLQLGEGDVHDGWTLDELTSTSARFSRGPQTAELLLEPMTGNRR